MQSTHAFAMDPEALGFLFGSAATAFDYSQLRIRQRAAERTAGTLLARLVCGPVIVVVAVDTAAVRAIFA